jgi:hypothetical protein
MSKSTVAEPTKSAQPAEAEPDAQATADASKEPSTPGALFHTRFSETFTSVIKSRAIRNSPDTAKLWRAVRTIILYVGLQMRQRVLVGVETLGGRLRADTHPIFEFHLAMSQVDMVKHLSDIHTTLINSTLTHLRAWIVVAAPQGNESKETIERFAAFRVGLSDAAGSVFTAQQWCDFAGGVATASLTPELLGDFTDSPPDAKRKRTE